MGVNFGTWLFTLLHGRLVGRDAVGNRYYEERRARPGMRQRRWVLYGGHIAGYVPEASNVLPEWDPWLHYFVDAPVPVTARQPWQLPYHPNLTGTPGSYRPLGHDYEGGDRARATGDYEAWTPES